VKTEYRKRFLKELSKVPLNQRKVIEEFIFGELLQLRSLEESGKIERMKGYPNFFKVRFGDYRVGLHIENEVIIERVLHRKEIYRYFP
jgi:mRNA interferase RelE/StbE